MYAQKRVMKSMMEKIIVSKKKRKKSWYLHIRIDVIRKEASVSSNQNESPGWKFRI